MPARFPLLKRKIDRIEALRRKPIEHIIRVQKLDTHTVSDGEIIQQFEDAALELTWTRAFYYIGLENGLVDETGRPLNQRAKRLVALGRKVHNRSRRDYLYDLKRHEHMLEDA